MYSHILITKISRLLKERCLTKVDLATRSGLSVSFISDLLRGKANPSLKTLESVATALNVPLPWLLDELPVSLPDGYTRISAVLPQQQAFIVNKWSATAKKQKKF